MTYSPTGTAVPSAQAGLTSLFGMGRGEPRRNNHLKLFKASSCVAKRQQLLARAGEYFCLMANYYWLNKLTYYKREKRRKVRVYKKADAKST